VTNFDLRPIDPAGPYVRPYLELARLAFKDSTPVTDDNIALRRRSYGEAYMTGAFDGDALVGTFRTWATHLTVPGEPRRDVPATAVSTVAVLPTHTRRGILSAQMRHHLDKAVADGSAVAVLIASEAVIYGRYGFGPATESTAIEVDLSRARMRPEVADPGGVTYISAEALRPLVAEIFDASRTPGEIDRPWWWWDHALEPEGPAGSGGRVVHLLRRDGHGVADGYLRYTFTDAWEHRVSKATLRLGELVATTPEAYVALWRYLLAVDAVATLTADPRPIDEPLAWMLVDSRALHRKERSDLLWTRLLDPAAFFRARGYEPGVSGSVVLQIEDPLGYAEGRFELSVDGAGRGECRPCTDRDPQVILPVDVVSSACLGGGDLLAAHRAGRAAERDIGAVARLAALLRTTRAPFDGTWF
jgi:predicted acetyltransferase